VDPEPGEQVFFHGHPSWRSSPGLYLRGLLLAVLAGALTGVITAAAAGKVEIGWVILVVLLAFLATLAAGLIRRVRTTYTITDQRLTIERGIFARDLQETRLERVQNVNSRQSLPERMLGVGTVDFDTAAGADYDFSFRGVGDPQRIVETVDQALRRLQQPGHAGL
jgi:uncharacterized membrane protein YdbT with pleckstrin-like domain